MLPPNVRRFNAHFSHGDNWGEVSPDDKDKTYESLDPENASIGQPINLSLIGFRNAIQMRRIRVKIEIDFYNVSFYYKSRKKN